MDEKRNLVKTVSECLREHSVKLAAKKGTASLCLIEVSAWGSLSQDFLDTYVGEVDGFKKRLAEKMMGKASAKVSTLQKYGVLVDDNLRYVFAFNRKFADLDRKGKKIAFKDAEDVLLGTSKGIDLSGLDLDIKTIPNFERKSSGSTVIRYAIAGAKGAKKKSTAEVNFEKASLLNRVERCYAENTVAVKTGRKQQRLLLVSVPYETLTLTDFRRTYRSVEGFKESIAKNVFGKKKTKNNYGVLLSQDLQIQFAFNEKFARYDPKTKSVVYSPVEEVLLNQTKELDLSTTGPMHVPANRRPRVPLVPSGRGGPTVFKYALQGAK